MTVLWAAWSIVAWSLAFLLMLLTAFVCLPLLPFSRCDRVRTWLYFRMLSLVPWLLLCRVRVTADPGFDPDRRSIYCMNHTSVIDPFVMIHVVPHDFCGLVNSVQLHMPVYGWMLRAGNAIAVRARSEGQSAAMTEQVRDRVGRGLSIVICPEAHRTVDGKLRDFKRGAFFMAREAGVPIVPAAVRGLYRILPKGAWMIRGGEVHVHLGPQVEVAGRTDEQIGELADRCKQYMAAWVERGELVPDAAAVLAPVAGGPVVPEALPAAMAAKADARSAPSEGDRPETGR